MGDLFNSVTDTLGITDSGAAADATRKGYAAMSAAQKEALEYLKEIDALPRQYRDQAMNQMANIYGFGENGAQGQQDFYAGLENDPFYKQIMSTMGDREEAYLRGQSATGQLRGAESIMGLGDIAADTRNQAFAGAYGNQLSGIQSLMGLPDYTEGIYNGMVGIGDTEGRGIIGVGQAEQEAEQAGWNNLLGTASLFTGIPAIGKGIGGLFGGGGGAGQSGAGWASNTVGVRGGAPITNTATIRY